MKKDKNTIFCNNCKTPLNEKSNLPSELRKPCPKCGSLSRLFKVSIHETVLVKEMLGFLGFRESKSKFLFQGKSGDDYHRKTGRWNKLSRLIDREKDLYHELIKDSQTGEIIHECKELLSEHRGQSLAKNKNPEK